MKTWTLFFMLAIGAGLRAQSVAHCTIYNEEGIRFTVYLNGEKQNETPQDRVRMINLTQDYYKIRIQFYNDSIPAIEHNIFQLTNGTGNKVDAVHVIRRNKKGEYGLHWKSQSDWPQYIEDKPTVVVVNNGVQQTTTTTTTTSDPGGNRFNFGVPGGNISINTGGAGAATTTRETTTTTNVAAPIAGAAPCTGNVLTQSEFADALKSIGARSTDEGKMLSAKQILSANCVNVDMVKSVLKLFNTDDKKLEIATYAYSNTVDKGSYYKLNSEFTSESSIDALHKTI